MPRGPLSAKCLSLARLLASAHLCPVLATVGRVIGPPLNMIGIVKNVHRAKANSLPLDVLGIEVLPAIAVAADLQLGRARRGF